jgi:hypothetical protein
MVQCEMKSEHRIEAVLEIRRKEERNFSLAMCRFSEADLGNRVDAVGRSFGWGDDFDIFPFFFADECLADR